MSAITTCQSCASRDIEPALFLGYHHACNEFLDPSTPSTDRTVYPIEVMLCPRCELVQLGHTFDQKAIFPEDYPYRSGATKQLRDNFADLASWVRSTVDLKPGDLVVDIGSNDGTLLSNFVPHCRVLGITPESAAKTAVANGIPTIQAYFSSDIPRHEFNPDLTTGALTSAATVITCTNCFAHVPDINDFTEGMTTLLAPGGIIVLEVQDVHATLDRLQLDCVYSEHTIYWSLTSIASHLSRHGLDIFRVQRIPTHGGSIRVWACRKGERLIEPEVAALAFWEGRRKVTPARFRDFAAQIKAQRAELWRAIGGRTVFGVGAPSRASTLLQWAGIDSHVMPVILEHPSSAKVGLTMPGSRIEVRAEPDDLSTLTAPDGTPVDALVLLSWHLADELVPKLRAKGWTGEIWRPLPEVRLL